VGLQEFSLHCPAPLKTLDSTGLQWACLLRSEDQNWWCVVVTRYLKWKPSDPSLYGSSCFVCLSVRSVCLFFLFPYLPVWYTFYAGVCLVDIRMLRRVLFILLVLVLVLVCIQARGSKSKYPALCVSNLYSIRVSHMG